MPLHWDELGRTRSGADYTMARALRRAASLRRDPWQGWDEATAQTLRAGALHTGDLGYLDEDGDLWLVQRRSDLIVTGGENVYPAEVEAALRTHPAVRDACVVGVAHPEWGQQVAGMIVADGGGRLPASRVRITASPTSRSPATSTPRADAANGIAR